MAAKNELSALVERFSGRRALIVGDMCLSRLESCRTIRFGHEAPALVLRYEGETTNAGWAGHVAVNAAALGAEPILVGLIGDDNAGLEVLGALERSAIDCSNMIVVPDRTTTTIRRIYAGGHNTNRRQVLRIEYEENQRVTAEQEREVTERLESLLPRVDGVYLCNHDRGTATRRVWMALHDGARKHKLHSVVDAGRSPLSFLGATVILQPEYELVEILREPEVKTPNEAAVLARNLQRKAQAQAVLLTRGNQGMVVVDGRKKPVHLGIYGPEDITDPSGVGDTVGATTLLALASGATVLQAGRLASYAGGIAVMRPALAAVSADDLTRAVSSRTL